MLVDLHLFGGRPNPRWQLDERSNRELRQVVATLGPASHTPRSPPGLGYGGFTYAARVVAELDRR